MSFPRKFKKNKYYFHCVFFDDKEAIFFIENLKHINVIFFLDIELKSLSFDWVKIKNYYSNKINFIYIQPNQITVKGIIETIINENYNNLLIVGSGNIAKNLCLRLNLISKKFYWTHLEENRISRNMIFMKKLFPNNYISEINDKFDCIINTVPYNFKIDLNNHISKNSCFIEVTGKNLDYLKNLTCKKYRFDFSQYLINELRTLLNLKKNKVIIGRKKFKNYFVCSGGYLGFKNDSIVDNYIKPKYIIGISDGMGGFLKRINKRFDTNIIL